MEKTEASEALLSKLARSAWCLTDPDELEKWINMLDSSLKLIRNNPDASDVGNEHPATGHTGITFVNGKWRASTGIGCVPALLEQYYDAPATIVDAMGRTVTCNDKEIIYGTIARFRNNISRLPKTMRHIEKSTAEATNKAKAAEKAAGESF